MNEKNNELTSNIGRVDMQESALEEIVYSSLQGMDGVRIGKENAWSFILRGIGGRKFAGIKVTKSNSEVVVDIGIYVRYGLNMPSVSRRVQDAVKFSLERMTELDIKEINVNVQGVDREV